MKAAGHVAASTYTAISNILMNVTPGDRDVATTRIPQIRFDAAKGAPELQSQPY